MGADCCGGGDPAVAAASAAVAGLAVAKPSPSKKAAGPPPKAHAECVADLQAFIAKRITLFEGYRARELAKVREAVGRARRADLGAAVRAPASAHLAPSSSTLPKLEAAKAANATIEVTMPDGGKREAVAGVTTPLDIAASISKSLAKNVVVAKVRGWARG